MHQQNILCNRKRIISPNYLKINYIRKNQTSWTIKNSQQQFFTEVIKKWCKTETMKNKILHKNLTVSTIIKYLKKTYRLSEIQADNDPRTRSDDRGWQKVAGVLPVRGTVDQASALRTSRPGHRPEIRQLSPTDQPPKEPQL